ncbi:fish-egg lectin-like [Dendronephthya gigantea]|uniref:fish-egg lectin-like n=1 Tax=Dendronephthya gigantea TaxID=151771 RepID=UPI00106901ED|nr:fish-egg lectin-like [Dendronephthya gigantea]
MRHNKDSNHDYYVMGPPTCCVEPCTNKKVCREEDCQCACPEGYLSYRCMCSKKNLARIFRKNTPVMLSDDMKQVESGSHTWGIKDDQSLWALINDQWVDQSDKMRYISNGKAGTWGIRPDYNVLVRDGEKWKSIPSSHQVFVQIDSGSSGVVFGVNDANEIYCRSNITMHSPYGSNWVKVPGTAKHVSCGDYGCWIVRPDDTVAFRENVTVKHCTGTGWIERSGKFVQLDSGRTGSVYGIAKNGTLHRLHGICEKVPMGQNIWTEILTVRFKHVTVGDTNMYAIAENGTVFKFFP